jgi:ABC-type lipoprotein export system ATPase subunit
MNQSQPLLTLRHVAKSFPAPEGTEPFTVLRDVSLEVQPGATLSIVGPSGCGKSTLLNLIGTLDEPTEGEIWLDGANVSAQSEMERAHLRNQQIGFIFQFHHLLPQCTVLENVLVPTLAAPNGTNKPATIDRARDLLKRVGLEPRIAHRPGQLSGGERQRCAVVRALINQPKLLLADEPTGSLDQKTAGELSTLLIELNREEGVALIVVTHALELAQQMQNTYALREGALHAENGGGAS